MLVTGGDDKKVNLWTIGAQTKALVSHLGSVHALKPLHAAHALWFALHRGEEPALNKQVALTCAAYPCNFSLPAAVQSLQGHSTPVESVTFDHNEEVVAAGAASGSIKLFDLDQAKGRL